MQHTFLKLPEKNGQLFTHQVDQYPTRIHAQHGPGEFKTRAGSSYLIYMLSGSAHIRLYNRNGAALSYPLSPGYYATLPATGAWPNVQDDGIIYANVRASLLIVERLNIDLPFSIGGPIPAAGDIIPERGNSETILMSPVPGGPYMAFEHYPKGLEHKEGINAALRIGVVTNGHGNITTPWGSEQLNIGDIFVIMPENGRTATGNDHSGHKIGTHHFTTEYHNMDLVMISPFNDRGTVTYSLDSEMGKFLIEQAKQ